MSAVRLVVNCLPANFTFSFTHWFSASRCHHNPFLSYGRTSATQHAVVSCKCWRPHENAHIPAGSRQRAPTESATVRGCFALGLVNSAAHWCRSQEPDTYLLNRLGRVFPLHQPQIADRCQPFIRFSKAPLCVAPTAALLRLLSFWGLGKKKILWQHWGDESSFKALSVRGDSTTDWNEQGQWCCDDSRAPGLTAAWVFAALWFAPAEKHAHCLSCCNGCFLFQFVKKMIRS